MNRNLIVTVLACLCLAAPGASMADERLWFGGGIGFSFGTVDYVEISPIVGFSATEQLSVGGGVLYRYRKDDRYSESLSTDDYGANVFVRYRFLPSVFAHAEYEYLSYEFVQFDLSTDRDDFNSLLVGPGFVQTMGDRSSFYALALYNFSYDDTDLYSPYSDAWSYRVGVSFGF
jgi:hypothetical protein